MNNTAPIWMGLAAIAGLVFIIGTGVAFVMYEFPITASVFVGALAASVAAVALFIGWAPPRDDAPVNRPIDTATIVDKAPVAAAPVATAAPTPAPVVAKTSAPVATPDPVVAAPAPAGKPVFLTAARDGGPDDLKLIRGVGPKLESTLHDMGVFHFDQIAAWGPAEEAWMDDNIEGFKGRVTRDEWVVQAKDLAAGGAA